VIVVAMCKASGNSDIGAILQAIYYGYSSSSKQDIQYSFIERKFISMFACMAAAKETIQL